jgi:hypothetical protein
MPPLERLRLAAALAHGIDGVRLELLATSGERVVVSHHPAADLDPCAFRQVVLASASPGGPDYSGRVLGVALGGAAEDLGGGVVRARTPCGLEQRWIATLLGPETAIDLLADIGGDPAAEDAMRACVKPDGPLGVSLVVLSCLDHRYDDTLDQLATRVAAACFVEELVRRASPAPRNGSASDGTGR